MTQVVIVAARRTPQGRFMGALSKRSAVDLAVAAATAALQGIGAENITQVIVGNVLGAGQGQSMARQVGVKCGVPLGVPAFTVNMMCASGLQAVALAAQAIRADGDAVVLCGGSESMTNAPYVLERARTGYRLGDGQLIDTVLRDGLVDAFDGEHMGLGAEALAERYGITRQKQDAFAAESQRRAGAAMRGGAFAAEVVPLDELQADEHPRPDTTAEKLATLKPAFNKSGTVTAGNASGINDGAAMLVVCSLSVARAKGWKPLATIEAATSVGCEPRYFGLGPVYATQRLCQQYDIDVKGFDVVEINEAFAAQALACIRDLKLDPAKVNPHGGAIALGHPIGASGARLATHLAHQIAGGHAERALATLCVGGGMGIAMALRKA